MPSITLTKANSVTKDTYVSQMNPSSSYGTSSLLNVGLNSIGDRFRSLLMFDLGIIPNDAVINSATLNLFMDSLSANNNPARISLHRITQDWDTSATWNTQPSFDPVASTSFLKDTTTTSFGVDVKSLVQSWVNGQFVNKGLLLKDEIEGTTTTAKSFGSFDNPTAARQPTLTIDYTIPTTGKKQVEYVGSGAVTGVIGNTLTLPLPTGLQSGDLLIAHFNYEDASSPTIPSGWTKLLENNYVSSARTVVAYKFHQQGDSNPSFRIGGSAYIAGILSAYRNVKRVVSGTVRGYSVNTATWSPPDFSVGVADTIFVLMGAKRTNFGTLTGPDSYAESYNVKEQSVGGSFISCMKYMHDDMNQTSSEMTINVNYSGGLTGTVNVFALEPITNNPPTLTLTSPSDNLTLRDGDTFTYSGTVTDPDAGDELRAQRQFIPQGYAYVPAGVSDGSTPSPFSYTYRYSKGYLYSANTGEMVPSGGPLQSADPVFTFWATDSSGNASSPQTRQFHIDQPTNGEIYLPVNVVTSAFLTFRMSPLVRLNNGWLVTALIDNEVTTSGASWNRIFISKDNGKTWALENSWGYTSGAYELVNSIATNGEYVYVLFAPKEGHVINIATFDPINDRWVGGSISVDSGQTAVNSVSLAITPDHSTLWWAASTKNSTYPNSFNIRAGSIPINADGTLGTPSAVSQVTTDNTSGRDNNSPSINFSGSTVFIIWQYATSASSLNAIKISTNSNGAWGSATTMYTGGAYMQNSPMGIRTPDSKLHVVWHATDSADTTNAYIRYENKKLVPGTNATITSDPSGKLFITYEDGGYIKRIASTDEFASWTGPVIIAPGSNPVSFYDPFFQTEFEIPPTLFQASGGGVKYYGVYTANENPETTVTSPEDGLVLTENMSFSITGAVSDVDVDDSVVVKAQINNGVPFNIGTGLSDGTTPIPFTRTLNYRNKRVWNGNTDVVGSDLAQNVDHLLKIWSEDDKGGKSTEIIRKFRVIWNRPPSISGADENLGTILSPPIKTYSVDDPEGNPFTVTEKINGKVIRTFTGVAGREETITIPHDLWIRLDLDTPHTLTVEATDSQGLKTTRTFTFTRTETHIEFMLDFNNPDVETHFTLDGMPKRVLVTLERYLPPGASIESVKVCNNALDEEPTWEDATTAVTAGRGYLFTNQTKTADNWGINIWVVIAKGSATERVRLDGYGGAFD